ncbi:MAG: DinB family protein [Bryobacteraceae bacterium]
MRSILLSLSLCALGFAQAPDFKSLVGSARALQKGVSNNLMKAAEKMPEESYAFKPSHDIRSFGQLVGHVADAQYLFCSAVIGDGMQPPGIEKSKTSKADLVAALKSAFEYCDKAYAISDEQSMQTAKFFGSDRNKAGVLFMNVSHNNEHYGNMVTYMRIRGLVPPSSERR